MEIKGTIELIKDTFKVSEKFSKREFVLKTEDQYPQFLIMEFVNEKTFLLEEYKVGDTVEVGVNLRGREWDKGDGERRFFNTIQAWKIGYSGQQADAIQGQEQEKRQTAEGDDLPF